MMKTLHVVLVFSEMVQFKTLVEALQHWAREKPDTPAVIFRDRHAGRRLLSWGSLHTLAGRFAAVLRREGLRRGEMVVNTLPNCPERYVCEAGVWMCGAASVNGQCLLADGSDLVRTLRQSRARAILVDPDVSGSPWQPLKNHVVLEKESEKDNDYGYGVLNVTSTSMPQLRKVFFIRRVSEETGDFLSAMTSQEEWFQADDITPDDVITVFTTSGSTGFSKLVVYTNGILCKTFQNDSEVTDAFKGSLLFNNAPLGWMGGCLHSIVVQGATRVTCDMRAGSPENMTQFIWDCIQEERCGSAYLSPVLLPELAQIADRYGDEGKKGEDEEQRDTKNGSGDEDKRGASITPTASDPTPSVWKPSMLIMGGLPITRHMVELGLKISESIMIAYGSTDSGVMSGTRITDSHTYIDHDAGKVSPHIQMKIVQADNESVTVPPNQIGHILTKNRLMMKEYLNDPQATANAFTEDGFFRTGDLGRLDERGHLIVDGRGSDAIMRGLYIFYPFWLESRLITCPGVREVVIVGVPDAAVNEELCACVVFESDDVSIEQVRQFVEKDIIATEDDPLSPRPRYYLKFESFPLTSTDKPTRKVIKEMAAKRLGLST